MMIGVRTAEVGEPLVGCSGFTTILRYFYYSLFSLFKIILYKPIIYDDEITINHRNVIFKFNQTLIIFLRFRGTLNNLLAV